MSLPPDASGGHLSGMSRASMRHQNDKLCKAVGLPDHRQEGRASSRYRRDRSGFFFDSFDFFTWMDTRIDRSLSQLEKQGE